MLKKRIKLLCALLAAAGILTSAGTPAAANGGELSVSAKAAVLMTADNSTVLYEKAAEEKLPMASTTKIMTALLTLEAAQAEDRQVKITDEMVRVEGSSMGLKPGNVVTLTALAQGMLLCSGNDAANAAAMAIAGSTEEFAKLMNQRAKQIGMKTPILSHPPDWTTKITIRQLMIWLCWGLALWRTKGSERSLPRKACRFSL